MNKTREQIRHKYGGRCAYCGCSLPDKWHIDHILPLERNPFTGEAKYPARDTLENCNPSCMSCNNYKHSMSLEQFREQIGLLKKRLNTDSRYKIAKRFGLLNEVDKEVKFYYETVSETPER